MKRLMFRNRIDDFLQEAAYILYSGWRNVHSTGWNVRSTPWNIRSSPWNIKLIWANQGKAQIASIRKGCIL